MKRIISVGAACAAVAVCAALSSARAQEADAAAEAPEAGAPAKAEKFFYPLLRCVRAEGAVQILKPRADAWVAAEEGRYYPLGSTVRASADAKTPVAAVFAFGEKATLTVTNAAEFATREVEIGEPGRTLVLKGGRVGLDLPRSLPDGLFTVAAPFFACSNLAGESQFDYAATGDGDEAVVRCVTGSMALEGRHYRIARMGAANQIRIRTTGDDLFTSLRGESGDCKVLLDQGLVPEKNFETGEVKEVPKTLEFALSPKCAIKIFRARASVSGRMAVSMMTFNASGEMQNRCAFTEGRANVNSGELVVAPAADETPAKEADDEDEAEAVEAKPAEEKPADDI